MNTRYNIFDIMIPSNNYTMINVFSIFFNFLVTKVIWILIQSYCQILQSTQNTMLMEK